MLSIIKEENSLICAIEPSTKEIIQKSNALFSKVVSINDLLSSDSSYFIFKHSNTCHISETVYGRVCKALGNGFFKDKQVYMVVVQEERDLSNKIAEFFNIKHESPQLLKVENGKVVESTSHYDVLKDF